jgi:hypothetical protein
VLAASRKSHCSLLADEAAASIAENENTVLLNVTAIWYAFLKVFSQLGLLSKNTKSTKKKTVSQRCFGGFRVSPVPCGEVRHKKLTVLRTQGVVRISQAEKDSFLLFFIDVVVMG